MATKTPDTVDIVRDLVAALTPIFLIDAAALLTSTTYRLDTFNTFWLRPEKVITIDSKQYRITSFVINESITIKDVTIGAGIPTVSSFLIPPPNFFHGTPVMMNNEHSRKKAAQDKTPFIWLQEVLEETAIDDRRSVFGRTSSPRIFFMDESKLTDWTSKQHKTNAIEPARQMTELFFANIRADRSMFGEIKERKDISRANWGRFVTDKGNIALLVNQNVSGVESLFDFQMTKKACDTRISGIICTIGVVIDKTDPTTQGGSDGTATANEFGDQSTVTYEWFDEFMVPIGQTDKTAIGLSEGTFFVEVTDAISANCVVTGSTTLEDPDAFIPPDIAGNVLWLDASDASTINAGSPVDNDPISIWADKSGNVNDATQTVPSARPLWKIIFAQGDGDDFMTLAKVISKLPNRTVFCVFKPDSVSVRQFVYGDLNAAGSSPTTSLVLEISITPTKYQSQYGNGINFRGTRGSSATTLSKTLYSDGFTSGAGPLVKMKINGVDETETDFGGSAEAIGGAKENFSIFRAGDFTSLNFAGQIQELVVYDSELSDANIALVENFLKTKHNIS